MKHPPIGRPIGRTCLLLSALLALCQLTACAPSSDTENPPVSQAPPPSSPSLPDTEAALRAYYEALIADLNQALLEARQEDYISKKDYEQRIAELESRIEALQRPTDPPDEVTDLPVSSIPAPPSDTPPPTATSAFTYTVENGTVTVRAYRGSSERVTVPPSIAGLPVTRIADDAFRATAITSVTLPAGITEIGWFSFADCQDLTAVTLPASVTAIGYGAFENCPRLTLLCPKDSYAYTYAQSFALPVMETDVGS